MKKIKTPYESIKNLEQAIQDLKEDQDKILEIFDPQNKDHKKLLNETISLEKEIKKLITEFKTLF